MSSIDPLKKLASALGVLANIFEEKGALGAHVPQILWIRLLVLFPGSVLVSFVAG